MAFYYCTQLVNINFAKNGSLNIIDAGAFEKCLKLKSLEIPSSITRICLGAFDTCVKLKSVYIPAGVTIENYAFFYCESLTDVIFENEAAVKIGHSVFSNTPWGEENLRKD